eukprot:1710453-Pleurochrysis_carterae.AAC.1
MSETSVSHEELQRFREMECELGRVKASLAAANMETEHYKVRERKAMSNYGVYYRLAKELQAKVDAAGASLPASTATGCSSGQREQPRSSITGNHGTQGGANARGTNAGNAEQRGQTAENSENSHTGQREDGGIGSVEDAPTADGTEDDREEEASQAQPTAAAKVAAAKLTLGDNARRKQSVAIAERLSNGRDCRTGGLHSCKRTTSKQQRQQRMQTDMELATTMMKLTKKSTS